MAFASYGEIEAAQLRVAGDRGTLSITTAELELTGEVDLRELPIVPREDKLWSDYFRVYNAQAISFREGSVSLLPTLPHVVEPSEPAAMHPVRTT